MIMLALFTVTVTNAQVTLQEAKVMDNVYVGVNSGFNTFKGLNDLHPNDVTLGLRLGKQLTPVYSVELEGIIDVNNKVNSNVVTQSYFGLNGLVNLNNLLCGYKEFPRLFEVNTVTGIGWIHEFNPNQSDKYHNYLGAKTGLNFSLNLGNSKQHTINLLPSITWNLSNPGNRLHQLAFNRLGARYDFMIGYTYHFKTSNGTHYFKTYNIETYESTIARLREELKVQPVQIREVVREVVVEKTNNKEATVTPQEYVVFFAKNSYLLMPEGIATLNKIKGSVSVYGYASPEGNKVHNDLLSMKRAEIVAEYLKANGVTVNKVVGCGAANEASNRVAIVVNE